MHVCWRLVSSYNNYDEGLYSSYIPIAVALYLQITKNILAGYTMCIKV